jgi:hypothetical protein
MLSRVTAVSLALAATGCLAPSEEIAGEDLAIVTGADQETGGGTGLPTPTAPTPPAPSRPTTPTPTTPTTPAPTPPAPSRPTRPKAAWYATAATPLLGARRVTRTQATHIVSTAAQLIEAVNGGPNRVIWIEAGADIVLTQTLTLPAGTTLASDRALDAGGFAPGARIRTAAALKPMLHVPAGSDRVRITGLRIEGPSASSDDDAPSTIGVQVAGARDARIDYNEIWKWAQAVEVRDLEGNITAGEFKTVVADSFVHHNERKDLGYGVNSGKGAYAQIERNTFNHNRHGVATGGEPGSGYNIAYSLFLSASTGYWGGLQYTSHIDMHGTGADGYGGFAGERFDIYQNTIAGDQSAYGTDIGTRPAVRVRGNPSVGVFFHHNAVDQDNSQEAVSVYCGPFSVCHPPPITVINDNLYGVTSENELAVGDFNGDGRDDVFRATGAGWWYSSGGVTEWRFLNAQTQRLSALRLADVDNNGETDVIVRAADGKLWVSSGGREILRELTPAPTAVPLRDLRFGDFTGDGIMDIFRTTNRQWYVWDGATRTESWVNSSVAYLSDLQFGEFDATRGWDVLSVNDAWLISSGARTGWTRINSELSSNVAAMRVADFNGDGRSDIAFQAGSTWYYSSSASGPRTALRTVGASEPPSLLARVLLGKFTADGRADALWYDGVATEGKETTSPLITVIWGPFFHAWTGIGSGNDLRRHSLHDMK